MTSVIALLWDDSRRPYHHCIGNFDLTSAIQKLARKGFAELQGSARLQPQRVTAFLAEHLFASCSSGFALMLPGTTFKSVPASLLTSPSSAALTLAFRLTVIHAQATSSVCSSQHGLILVPGRRLAVVLKGIRCHHGMPPASLGCAQHTDAARS